MVSIVEKSKYLDTLKENRLVQEFILFLNKDLIASNKSVSFARTEDVIYEGMFAFQKNDKNAFKVAYSQISQREIDTSSTWIFDDILIFVLICCVLKFDLEKDFLYKIINQRNNSQDQECKKITTSFRDLLNSNFDSVENYYPIILVYKFLNDDFSFNERLINHTYSVLSTTQFPFYDSTFLNVVTIKAIDVMFLAKGLENITYINNLKRFDVTFTKRTECISKSLSILFNILILSFSIYYISKNYDENNKEWNIFLVVIAIGGFGISQFLPFSKKWLSKVIKKSIHLIFGYKI